MNQWRTLPSGQVEVNGRVPLPPAADAARVETSVIARWGALLMRFAQAYGVPWAWLVGICATESWGDPNAKSTAGACGLMQLMPSTASGIEPGVTVAQLFDPETNVRIAAKLLQQISRANGADLPKVASVYNAGGGSTNTPHVRASDPWGMVENDGYIDGVVSRANYAFARGALPLTRVMLIGDSLTTGIAPALANKLPQGVVLVGRGGSQNAKHEGYPGETIQQVSARMGGALAAQGGTVDIAVITLGTNNVAAGDSPASMDAAIATLIDQLGPHVRAIIVDTIPPFMQPGAGAKAAIPADFDTRLAALVKLRRDMGQRVFICDAGGAVSVASIAKNDGVHPMGDGYVAMADAINATIARVLAELRAPLADQGPTIGGLGGVLLLVVGAAIARSLGWI